MASDTVQSNIRELEALRAQSRYWRWGITLTLLVIVIFCLVTLREAVTGLTTEGATRDAFNKDLGDRIQRNAVPTIEQMGAQALHEVNFEAEVKKLNQRTPELAQAAMQQVKLLEQDLPTRGQKVLNATFGEAMKQHESKLRTLFPEATNEQINSLMTNLETEATEQAPDINDQLFARHKQAIDSILHDFTAIQNSGGADAKGQMPTWDMALLIFDLARNDLKTLSPDAGAAKTAGSSAKGTNK